MTGLDTFVLIMMLLEVIAVGVLAWTASLILETARRGRRIVQPALSEASALGETGRAVAARARRDGTVIVGRVRAVAGRVQQRVATTRRIAGEIRPAAARAAGVVRERTAAAAGQASALGDLARRAGRVRSAARAAAEAARQSE